MQSWRVSRALLAVGVVVSGLVPLLTSSAASAAQEQKQSYIVVLKDTVGRASSVANERRSQGDDVHHVYETALKG
jgi:hypothetical protein